MFKMPRRFSKRCWVKMDISGHARGGYCPCFFGSNFEKTVTPLFMAKAAKHENLKNSCVFAVCGVRPKTRRAFVINFAVFSFAPGDARC